MYMLIHFHFRFKKSDITSCPCPMKARIIHRREEAVHVIRICVTILSGTKKVTSQGEHF